MSTGHVDRRQPWYEPAMTCADPSFVIDHVSWSELGDLLSSPARRADLGGPAGGALVVHDAPPDAAAVVGVPGGAVEVARQLPVLVVLDAPVSDPTDALPRDVSDLVDLVASGDDLELALERAASHPHAATSLALLLRSG